MSRILQLSAVLIAASFLPSVAQAQSADGAEAETHEAGPKDNKTINRGGGGGGKAANNNNAGKKKKKKKKRKGPKLVGPFPKKKYPTQERLRPLVLPDGMGEVGLSVNYANVASTNSVGIGAGFDFGIGDKVEVGLSSALSVVPSPVAWSESVTLHGHYLAVDGKKFDWAPGVVLPISFQSGAPFMLAIDLPGRLLVGDKAFLHFGRNAIPITVSPDFAMAVAGNGGVGVQFSKITALLVGLDVFSVTLVDPNADGVAGTGVWETLNLDASLQFTPSDTVDVGITGGVTNVWNADDSLVPRAGVYGAVRF